MANRYNLIVIGGGSGGIAESKLDYSNIPTLAFAHPPIGTAGLSDQLPFFGLTGVEFLPSIVTSKPFSTHGALRC